jgi:hypothetical protein
MSFSITLTLVPQQTQNQGFEQTITATNAVNLPNEIFVMTQGIQNPQTGARAVVFSNVATPAQLQSLPIGAPLAGSLNFRLAATTSIYNTSFDAANAWSLMQIMVQDLLNALNAAEQVGSGNQVTLTSG